MSDRYSNDPLPDEETLLLAPPKETPPTEAAQENNLLFTPEEADCLVDILEKALSTEKADQNKIDLCTNILRRISLAYGIFPRSFNWPDIILSSSEVNPNGTPAGIQQEKSGGFKLRVKVFRTWTPGNLDRIKQRLYYDVIGWKSLNHPNVVPFLGILETLGQFGIISPWQSGGNIRDYVRNDEKANRFRLLAEAAKGLEYLHSQGVVHGSVQPGNILVDAGGVARLGDFGIAGIILDPNVVGEEIAKMYKHDVVRYMAPELVGSEPSSWRTDKNPTKGSDIYSFATTVLEILTGEIPFSGCPIDSTIRRISTGEKPRLGGSWLLISNRLWFLIEVMWNQNCDDRLKLQRIQEELLKESANHLYTTYT